MTERMAVTDQLLALQWAQVNHDQNYHRDVSVLPTVQRIKHMAFHYAKYAAYLLEAVEQHDDVRVDSTLVDAFIIALATANILNHQLSADLHCENEASLSEVGARLVKTLPRNAADELWVVKQFVRLSGRLAKMCESLDHLEALPFRDELTTANCSLLKIVLAEASIRQLDLPGRYRARIRSVEERSMFDRQIKRSTEE
jgi:hypothetical protein